MQAGEEQPQDSARSNRPLINNTTPSTTRACVDRLSDDEPVLALDEFNFVISEESLQRLLDSGLEGADERAIGELFKAAMALKKPKERYTEQQWQQRFALSFGDCAI